MNFAWLRAQPASPPIDPSLVAGTYRYWRIRIMYGLFFGYAFFYLIRLSLSVATPALMLDLICLSR